MWTGLDSHLRGQGRPQARRLVPPQPLPHLQLSSGGEDHWHLYRSAARWARRQRQRQDGRRGAPAGRYVCASRYMGCMALASRSWGHVACMYRGRTWEDPRAVRAPQEPSAPRIADPGQDGRLARRRALRERRNFKHKDKIFPGGWEAATSRRRNPTGDSSSRSKKYGNLRTGPTAASVSGTDRRPGGVRVGV